MVKTLDVLAETVRNSKHSFRHAELRPRKEQQHRYERRKIREFIRLGEWAPKETA